MTLKESLKKEIEEATNRLYRFASENYLNNVPFYEIKEMDTKEAKELVRLHHSITEMYEMLNNL